MHDLGLSHARELSTTLGKALYEILERLAVLLGACPQVPEVPRTHVCALEVPHKCADLVILVMDLAGWKVFKTRPG
jgi:hypothetical protein